IISSSFVLTGRETRFRHAPPESHGDRSSSAGPHWYVHEEDLSGPDGSQATKTSAFQAMLSRPGSRGGQTIAASVVWRVSISSLLALIPVFRHHSMAARRPSKRFCSR